MLTPATTYEDFMTFTKNSSDARDLVKSFQQVHSHSTGPDTKDKPLLMCLGTLKQMTNACKNESKELKYLAEYVKCYSPKNKLSDKLEFSKSKIAGYIDAYIMFRDISTTKEKGNDHIVRSMMDLIKYVFEDTVEQKKLRDFLNNGNVVILLTRRDYVARQTFNNDVIAMIAFTSSTKSMRYISYAVVSDGSAMLEDEVFTNSDDEDCKYSENEDCKYLPAFSIDQDKEGTALCFIMPSDDAKIDKPLTGFQGAGLGALLQQLCGFYYMSNMNTVLEKVESDVSMYVYANVNVYCNRKAGQFWHNNGFVPLVKKDSKMGDNSQVVDDIHKSHSGINTKDGYKEFDFPQFVTFYKPLDGSKFLKNPDFVKDWYYKQSRNEWDRLQRLWDLQWEKWKKQYVSNKPLTPVSDKVAYKLLYYLPVRKTMSALGYESTNETTNESTKSTSKPERLLEKDDLILLSSDTPPELNFRASPQYIPSTTNVTVEGDGLKQVLESMYEVTKVAHKYKQAYRCETFIKYLGTLDEVVTWCNYTEERIQLLCKNILSRHPTHRSDKLTGTMFYKSSETLPYLDVYYATGPFNKFVETGSFATYWSTKKNPHHEELYDTMLELSRTLFPSDENDDAVSTTEQLELFLNHGNYIILIAKRNYFKQDKYNLETVAYCAFTSQRKGLPYIAHHGVGNNDYLATDELTRLGSVYDDVTAPNPPYKLITDDPNCKSSLIQDLGYRCYGLKEFMIYLSVQQYIWFLPNVPEFGHKGYLFIHVDVSLRDNAWHYLYNRGFQPLYDGTADVDREDVLSFYYRYQPKLLDGDSKSKFKNNKLFLFYMDVPERLDGKLNQRNEEVLLNEIEELSEMWEVNQLVLICENPSKYMPESTASIADNSSNTMEARNVHEQPQSNNIPTTPPDDPQEENKNNTGDFGMDVDDDDDAKMPAISTRTSEAPNPLSTHCDENSPPTGSSTANVASHTNTTSTTENASERSTDSSGTDTLSAVNNDFITLKIGGKCTTSTNDDGADADMQDATVLAERHATNNDKTATMETEASRTNDMAGIVARDRNDAVVLANPPANMTDTTASNDHGNSIMTTTTNHASSNEQNDIPPNTTRNNINVTASKKKTLKPKHSSKNQKGKDNRNKKQVGRKRKEQDNISSDLSKKRQSRSSEDPFVDTDDDEDEVAELLSPKPAHASKRRLRSRLPTNRNNAPEMREVKDKNGNLVRNQNGTVLLVPVSQFELNHNLKQPPPKIAQTLYDWYSTNDSEVAVRQEKVLNNKAPFYPMTGKQMELDRYYANLPNLKAERVTLRQIIKRIIRFLDIYETNGINMKMAFGYGFVESQAFDISLNLYSYDHNEGTLDVKVDLPPYGWDLNIHDTDLLAYFETVEGYELDETIATLQRREGRDLFQPATVRLMLGMFLNSLPDEMYLYVTNLLYGDKVLVMEQQDLQSMENMDLEIAKWNNKKEELVKNFISPGNHLVEAKKQNGETAEANRVFLLPKKYYRANNENRTRTPTYRVKPVFGPRELNEQGRFIEDYFMLNFAYKWQAKHWLGLNNLVDLPMWRYELIGFRHRPSPDFPELGIFEGLARLPSNSKRKVGDPTFRVGITNVMMHEMFVDRPDFIEECIKNGKDVTKPNTFLKIKAGNFHEEVNLNEMTGFITTTRTQYLQGKRLTCLVDSFANALYVFGLVEESKKLHDAGFGELNQSCQLVVQKTIDLINNICSPLCMFNLSHVKTCKQALALDSKWPIMLTLCTSDLAAGQHAVSIVQGLIFDSNCEVGLTKSQESLDWATGSGTTCTGIHDCYQLRPRHHSHSPELPPVRTFADGSVAWLVSKLNPKDGTVKVRKFGAPQKKGVKMSPQTFETS